MKLRISPAAQRRGALVPLTALLLVVLLGAVAFAVDIGWLVTTRAELQNAADASALAGHHPLMDGYVQYSLAPDATAKAAALSAALANARARAKEFAGYNTAGGVTNLVLNDSDIEFGFLDSNDNYTPLASYTGFPNTIKVLLRRDSQANQPVSLFFGPALGKSSVDVNATASATTYTGVIQNFSTTGFNSVVLPLTYDVNFWNNFLSTGTSPDGETLTDANGVPQLHVYPSKQYKGNFGQLSLNDSSVGNSTEVAWVESGMSAADIQALRDANLIPLDQHSPTAWDWQGSTGMKGSLIQTVNDQVGKIAILPLFKPVNATQADYQAGVLQGTNYSYNIVQFVGVRIMPVSKSNKDIVMQPAAVIDPNAVFVNGSIAPAGTSNQLVTTFTAPKLTR